MPWTPRIASNARSLQENNTRSLQETASKSMHTINKEDPQYNETLLRPVSEDK